MVLPVDEEFATFVAAQQGPLLRAAVLLTGDHASAEDLVQEALVKVAQRWPRLRDQSPAAYARRIIYRDNVSRWRSTRREQIGAPIPERGADPLADQAQRLAVRSAIAGLPPRQRAVVVLRYLEDLTEVETAKVLGVSVGTVKSQHHDALRRLRDLLPELRETGDPDEGNSHG